MIAKTWSGILTEIGVESFARRIKRKLTVSLEHIILAIILVHLYIPMYIENIPKSSSSLSLVWPAVATGRLQYLGMYILHPPSASIAHKNSKK